MGTIRVMSLNLWGFFGEWDRRRDVLRQEIEHISPDVIVTQEACRREGCDQHAELAHLLGYGHIAYAGGHREDGHTEGVGIISRIPLVMVESLPLPDSHPRRCAISAAVSLPGGDRVRVIGAHTVFHPWPVLEAQITELVALAVAGRGPVVLAGDLNTTPDHVAAHAGPMGLSDVLGEDSTPTWPGCPVEDFRAAWQAATGRETDFPIEPRRLDYILTGGLRAESARIQPLGSRAHGFGSDHAAVIADLAV